ncbi:hypothetical protein [Plastoroseomonas arctica]|uniref:Uncharacterized protein n=1 Tax=Plastoroseomonas arctica TaxID=1509237 RepID=A0AAF1K3X2_9PROT|nr:hypothetical protein [Plastoroseomonas arctica]MBR0655791.1 hypothetical protein [Plastoroseomonas arctica]
MCNLYSMTSNQQAKRDLAAGWTDAGHSDVACCWFECRTSDADVHLAVS